ncbi:MAG: alcohol dehydrogenase [Thermoplasmata archaeon]|nr:MAG: alcohol dehydrogenase [Thermoplasmata archaeon]
MWRPFKPSGEIVEMNPSEIRLRTTLYFGPGAVGRMEDILGRYRRRGARRVGIVTGTKSHILSGAWDRVEEALEKNDMEFELSSGVPPNPTVDVIEEAVELFKSFGPEVIVGIGGGSPIDASKAAGALLKSEGKSALDLYTYRFHPKEALPIVAVNLTHGTGTEVDRYAVATIPEKRVKLGAASDAMYPEFAVDDPELTLSLPEKQSLYVTLDAVNHAVEAATTTVTSRFTEMLSRECLGVVADHLPRLKDHLKDVEVRGALMHASMVAGVAIDNSRAHITHLLEHALSALKPEVPHGLGLAILLPAVLKEIYPARAEVLSRLLRPIVPGLKGREEEAEAVAREVERWTFSVGVEEKLSDIGIGEEDVGELVEIAFSSPALKGTEKLSPVGLTREMARRIYENSLYPLSE